MSTHRHEFKRLSEVSVFCACGEIKVAEGYAPAPCPLPHYPVFPVYPQPVIYPRPWTPTWPIWYGTYTIDGSSEVMSNGTLITSSTFAEYPADSSASWTAES